MATTDSVTSQKEAGDGPSLESTAADATKDDDSDDDNGWMLACCLCNCAVDYSEKEAFFESDQNRKFLLPESLYDAHNAIVLCDTCDRPYHQRCHFVPLISLPRGDWHCLLCQSTSRKHGLVLNRSYTKEQIARIYPPHAPDSNNNNGDTNMDQMESQKLQQQQQWEWDTRLLKAQLWKRELMRLASVLSQQLQHVRMAQTTLRAYTSTRRAQQQLSFQSQELCQTIVKLTSAKLRIRQLLLSLSKVLLGEEKEWAILLQWLEEHPLQEETWFPFGRYERRMVPRLQVQDAKPEEITVSMELEQDTKVTKVQDDDHKDDEENDVEQDTTVTKGNDEDHKDDQEDDLISLDDLKCSICFRGDATDENDVLLCDGAGCFRAYHMQCLSPALTMQQVEAEEDWFCPICTALAKTIASVQSEYMGDEWEKEAKDDDSVKSWEQVSDVFPEAEHEYEMAMKWKEGNGGEETVVFLSSLLGMIVPTKANDEIDDDDDEEDDDDDFDFDAFQNRVRENEENESVASSLASLQDMSSVEINIDRSELDALSSGSSDNSDLEEDEELASRRRRTRSSRTISTESASTVSSKPVVDVGTLDESNIVQGKRRRSRVDYRRLNDSMFGDLSESEAARLLDDDDEFNMKRTKSKPSNGRKRGRRRKESVSTSEGSSESEEVAEVKRTEAKSSSGRKRGPKKSVSTSEGSSESEEVAKDNGSNRRQQRKGPPMGKKTNSRRGTNATRVANRNGESDLPIQQNGSRVRNGARTKVTKLALMADEIEEESPKTKSPRQARRKGVKRGSPGH